MFLITLKSGIALSIDAKLQHIVPLVDLPPLAMVNQFES
jgi:hypothetical protein